MKTALLLLALEILGFHATAGTLQDIRVNEIRIDQTSTDTDEYFELTGPPELSLDGLSYVVIGESATSGSGGIEEVTDLTGFFLSPTGYFVAAEATFALGPVDLTTDLHFENADNVTHLLVTGFTGQVDDDLDTNDDGFLDIAPWTEVVDRIAIIVEENPPTGTEFHYGPPTVGPAASGVPGHVNRCADSWLVGPFDPVGGLDTPGAANDCPFPPIGICGDPVTFIHDIQGSTPNQPPRRRVGCDHRRDRGG